MNRIKKVVIQTRPRVGIKLLSHFPMSTDPCPMYSLILSMPAVRSVNVENKKISESERDRTRSKSEKAISAARELII